MSRAEALSGNCCQKRRARIARTGSDDSAGWWVIYFETCYSEERARGRENGKTHSRTTNLPVAAVRRLAVRKNT